MVGPAVFLLAAVYTATSDVEAAAFIAVGTGLSALSLGAVSVNHLDVAPKYAGLVFGMGNTAGILAGALAVPVSGWVLDVTGKSWGAVFWIFAAHYLLGTMAFLGLVSDERIDLEEADARTLVPSRR